MIHQHFKLVDVFTAAENIVLGLQGAGAATTSARSRPAVREISERYGFDIDPDEEDLRDVRLAKSRPWRSSRCSTAARTS